MFRHQHLHFLSQIKQIRIYFHPLEVVSRYREPQIHVGENLNKRTWREKGLFIQLL